MNLGFFLVKIHNLLFYNDHYITSPTMLYLTMPPKLVNSNTYNISHRGHKKINRQIGPLG